MVERRFTIRPPHRAFCDLQLLRRAQLGRGIATIVRGSTASDGRRRQNHAREAPLRSARTVPTSNSSPKEPTIDLPCGRRAVATSSSSAATTSANASNRRAPRPPSTQRYEPRLALVTLCAQLMYDGKRPAVATRCTPPSLHHSRHARHQVAALRCTQSASRSTTAEGWQGQSTSSMRVQNRIGRSSDRSRIVL
jgi:hypothetical protein